MGYGGGEREENQREGVLKRDVLQYLVNRQVKLVLPVWKQESQISLSGMMYLCTLEENQEKRIIILR